MDFDGRGRRCGESKPGAGQPRLDFRAGVGEPDDFDSSATFCRQESASMSSTWQCWTKRSTRAATHAAPGKIVPHCLKGRLVVMTVERCSCLRLTMLYSRSAERLSQGR